MGELFSPVLCSLAAPELCYFLWCLISLETPLASTGVAQDPPVLCVWVDTQSSSWIITPTHCHSSVLRALQSFHWASSYKMNFMSHIMGMNQLLLGRDVPGKTLQWRFPSRNAHCILFSVDVRDDSSLIPTSDESWTNFAFLIPSLTRNSGEAGDWTSVVFAPKHQVSRCWMIPKHCPCALWDKDSEEKRREKAALFPYCHWIQKKTKGFSLLKKSKASFSNVSECKNMFLCWYFCVVYVIYFCRVLDLLYLHIL